MIDVVETKKMGALFMVAFVYAIIAMEVSREIIIPRMLPGVVNGHISGDPQYYNELAIKKTDEIKAKGMTVFQIRPEGQGPAGGASLIYLLVESPYGFVIINAFLHAVSAIAMVLILRHWFSFSISAIASLPVAISVGMMFWFSQLNKDSVVLAGALLFICGLLKLVARKEGVLLGLLGAVVGVFFIGLMRPYVNQMLLPVTAIILLVVIGSRLKNRCRCSDLKKIVAAALFLLFFISRMSIGAASDKTLNSFAEFDASSQIGRNPRLASVDIRNWENSPLLPKFINTKLKTLMGQRCLMLTVLDADRNSTTLSSVLDAEILPGSSMAALAYLPRAALIGIFSPWPDRWLYALHHKSFFYVVTPFEAMVIYLGIVGIVIWVFRHRQWLLAVPITISLFIMTIYGMTTPFLGALYRYRYPWWMLLICLGVASWGSLIQSHWRSHRDVKPSENKSCNAWKAE